MQTGKKRVLLLGASGSIGKSTLDVLRTFPDKFELTGFSVHSDIEFGEKIKTEFPKAFFYSTAADLSGTVKKLIEESNADIAVNGIAGSQGLRASVEVVNAGMDLALANKETIVTAGELIFEHAVETGSKIIPVDSEHAAVFNLIAAHKKENISRIIITASGGPFRNTPFEELKNMTANDALKHPTWNMGGKITIDSASLANKALEVIEAVKLFGVPACKITVTVHPQSIVHSMVQTLNGEVYAQMSPPDMRNPILNALSFEKMPIGYLPPLNFEKMLKLEFIPPRREDFPMLDLGFLAAEKLAAYPIAFNAANEQAVEAFFCGKIKFTDLAYIVQRVLDSDWTLKPSSYTEVYSLESKAKELAEKYITALA
ncbi:1-deoxy-D-xylulose-5-phosphate reductoisomerase [Treponema pedis]|uniref:1-deoxy-D-xylulose-5-phosphate reductoisomerase n=1 Tax=Treponema pedis TaxID=409322 RepID=UPI000410B326|nr:1-deoxy-D-xylulose-5-phosphate reductoisomerase [Treponema pedis]